MSDDAIKQAEAHGYSRGYAAGRKKTEGEVAENQRLFLGSVGARRAFWSASFCAMLPHVGTWGWTQSDGTRKNVKSMRDYAKMAGEMADQAVIEWDRR